LEKVSAQVSGNDLEVSGFVLVSYICELWFFYLTDHWCARAQGWIFTARYFDGNFLEVVSGRHDQKFSHVQFQIRGPFSAAAAMSGQTTLKRRWTFRGR